MTLAEFQPYVETALAALEWETARARWRQGLIEESEAITKALPLAGSYGVEAAPLEARLAQITQELTGDVTADRVPQHPVRSVPMDLITEAVVRRLVRVPASFPVLSIKTAPALDDVRRAIADVAQRWQHPNGAIAEEPQRTI